MTVDAVSLNVASLVKTAEPPARIGPAVQFTVPWLTRERWLKSWTPTDASVSTAVDPKVVVPAPLKFPASQVSGPCRVAEPLNVPPIRRTAPAPANVTVPAAVKLLSRSIVAPALAESVPPL